MFALVNPVLALGLLAVAGLLAARLPRPSSRRPPSLDLAITAGAPLVLLGLLAGPGIALLSPPLVRALAPLTACAIGWIGAAFGARLEWGSLRRIPRGARLLAAAGAGGALGRAAALETACAALAMSVPLGLRHPVSWPIFALGSGALVGLAFSGVTGHTRAGQDVSPALAGTVLFGAGIGYTTDLSPFMVCALAGVVMVNASPRRRAVRAALRAWERPSCALLLIMSGALLMLSTLWILAAVAGLGGLRAR